jgi:hypothetical protein
MIQINQIENLIEFTGIFLSGDLNFKLESEDYYKEKFDKYIGTPIKFSDKKSEIYIEWSKIWGKNENINSMMNYFISIIKIYKNKNYLFSNNHWLTSISPDELLNMFIKYIGDSTKINNQRYENIHPCVKKNIYDVYINEYLRYFKFLRILKKY